ncbi:uncharacterized protein LOC141908359 [Tubulanus polymorphus]|uniref:uncharacterized protein LOC141908359 n=1 Tax=Tubulanus polymorphus TaxID=672921 RepID=UPI003DA1CBC4
MDPCKWTIRKIENNDTSCEGTASTDASTQQTERERMQDDITLLELALKGDETERKQCPITGSYQASASQSTSSSVSASSEYQSRLTGASSEYKPPVAGSSSERKPHVADTSSTPSLSTVSFVRGDSSYFSETDDAYSQKSAVTLATSSCTEDVLFVDVFSEDGSTSAQTAITVDRASYAEDSKLDDSMVGIDIEIGGEDLPCDPETCLALNRAYQEVIEEYLQSIENLLSQNLEKQEELEKNIQKMAEAKVSSTGQKKIWGNFNCPFIRGKRGQYPPENEDVRTKRQRDEPQPFLPRLRIWTNLDKKKLNTAVIREGREKILRPLMNKLENELCKLERAEPKSDQREMISKNIDDINAKITAARQMSGKEILNLPREEIKEIDWMKISVQDFDKATSDVSLELSWKNLLHPAINHGVWTREEDTKLRSLIRIYDYRSWDRIASELGTNRTALQCLQRFQSNLREIPVREWSAAEDKILTEVVDMCTIGSEVIWRQVSYYIEGRSPNQCRGRWQKLNPVMKHNRWSPHEDQLLREVIEKCGDRLDWKLISSQIPGRSPIQCAERYENSLIRGIKRDAWTYAEDHKLLSLAIQFPGGRWATISNYMPGRTDHQCMQRFRVLTMWKKRDAKTKELLKNNPGQCIPYIKEKLIERHSKLLERDPKPGVPKKKSPPDPPLVIFSLRYGITLVQEWLLKVAQNIVERLLVNKSTNSSPQADGPSSAERKQRILNYLSEKMNAVENRKEKLSFVTRPVQTNVQDSQKLAAFVDGSIQIADKNLLLSILRRSYFPKLQELLYHYTNLQKLQSNQKFKTDSEIDESMASYLGAIMAVARRGRKRKYIDQSLSESDLKEIEPMLGQILFKLMRTKECAEDYSPPILTDSSDLCIDWWKYADSEELGELDAADSSDDIPPIPPNVMTLVAFRCLLLERRKLQLDVKMLDAYCKSAARKRLGLPEPRVKRKKRKEKSVCPTVKELIERRRIQNQKMSHQNECEKISATNSQTIELQSLPQIPDLHNILTRLASCDGKKGMKIYGTKSMDLIKQLSKCVGIDITQPNVKLKAHFVPPASEGRYPTIKSMLGSSGVSGSAVKTFTSSQSSEINGLRITKLDASSSLSAGNSSETATGKASRNPTPVEEVSLINETKQVSKVKTATATALTNSAGTSANPTGTPMNSANSAGTPISSANSVGTVTTSANSAETATTSNAVENPTKPKGTPTSLANSAGTATASANSAGIPTSSANSAGTLIASANSAGTPASSANSAGTPASSANSAGTPTSSANSAGAAMTSANSEKTQSNPVGAAVTSTNQASTSSHDAQASTSSGGNCLNNVTTPVGSCFKAALLNDINEGNRSLLPETDSKSNKSDTDDDDPDPLLAHREEWDQMFFIRQTDEYQLLRKRFLSLFLWPGFLSTVILPEQPSHPSEAQPEEPVPSTSESSNAAPPPAKKRKGAKKVQPKPKKPIPSDKIDDEVDGVKKPRRGRPRKSRAVPPPPSRRSTRCRTSTTIRYTEPVEAEDEVENEEQSIEFMEIVDL